MNVALFLLALLQQPQDTVVLKPIVVTATRVRVAADLIPSAVTVLRGTDLVAQGIRTVAEALETVPGAHIAETGSFGGQTSLFMRGGESDYTKVLLGRYPHLSLWGRERAEDHDAVDRALAACDVAHLADRWLWTLSGGEYQRVRVARALAQEPKLLVLDEPGMSLDLKHEMGLFELVLGLVRGQGLGVLMITHDLNLAARFADSLLLLEGGRPVAAGAPNDVLTQQTVETVFSWPVAMQTVDGRPQMIPLRQSKESRA